MKKRSTYEKIFILIVILTTFACTNKDTITLNVFNWAEYIDETLLDQFEKENNIKINYEIFHNNEEMMAKFNNTKNYYDIIVPSEYLIQELIDEGKIEKLDYSKLPNVTKNITQNLTNLEHDPGNLYSVPAYWGLMGILYNKTKIDLNDMRGFDILFNKNTKKRLQC